MTTPSEDSPERRAIEDLLPWYAAGTLSRREARQVEEALAQDPELARRYELVRDELAATIHLNETLGAPSAHARENLFARIDAAPPRRPAPGRRLGASLVAFFAGLSPRTLAWSSSAALLILLQIGAIGVLLKGQDYHVASLPGDTTAEGSYALIRFAPQASADDITKFLEANQAIVVDGPRPGGLYRVRVAATRLSKAELAAVIKHLEEADKIVNFVVASE